MDDEVEDMISFLFFLRGEIGSDAFDLGVAITLADLVHDGGRA